MRRAMAVPTPRLGLFGAVATTSWASSSSITSRSSNRPKAASVLAYGQRCGCGVVFNAEVQRRNVEGGRGGQLLEFGNQRRGRVPQLQPVDRAGRRPGHLPEEGVPQVGHASLSCPTWATAIRRASQEMAKTMGWKLPLLIMA